MTADGKFRRASPDENPDLYWGLRGGGGNFGVVTNFEFRLHEMDRQVTGGMIGFPMAEARKVLNFYADYALEAPDELALEMVMVGQSPENSLITLQVCYCGPHGKAEPLLQKVRSAGTVIVDDVRAMDYVALQRSGDSSDPRGVGSYTKSGFLSELGPDFIDAVVSHFGFYTNDLIDESQEQIDRNYMGNHERLVALKNRYDPENLFRLNANVRPNVQPSGPG